MWPPAGPRALPLAFAGPVSEKGPVPVSHDPPVAKMAIQDRIHFVGADQTD